MAKIQFYPLSMNYKVIDEKPVIFLFGRTIGNEQICVVDEGFEPYFYVLLEDNNSIDEVRKKIEKIEAENKDTKYFVKRTEQVQKKSLGKDITVIKVFVNLPEAVPGIRNIIKVWDDIKATKEYDIKFVRRYLIDKNITPSTLTEAEVEPSNIRTRVPVFTASSIKQVSDASIEKPNILAFDIETYNPFGKQMVPEKNPILMVALHGENFRKVITWKQFKTEEDYVEFVGSESELIERFKRIIEAQKPDIITGYFSDGFDWPYIKARAKKYKIKLDLGLDFSDLIVGKKTASIIGIAHVDIFKFIRKIVSRRLETDIYTLNAVAEELLGEGKEEVDLDSLTHVWDNKPEHLEKFCKYNLKDAYLTLRLTQKLLPQIEELVKIIGIPLYDINRMSFSQLVEWYLIKQIKPFNELIPNTPTYNDIEERKTHTYKGAFVFEPKPGLYKDIAVFDFRSLYPTIITAHNICLSTLNCCCCRDNAEYAPTEEKKYWFCKNKKGFIPSIIEDVITRRARVKDIIKETLDPKKRFLLEARSEGLKVLANSFYGYLGFFGARWYSIESALSVTAWGRHYINKVIDEAIQKEFDVLYGDTDSVFTDLKGKTEKDALKFVEEINSNLPEMMELEFEGFYPSGIFVSAKVGPFGAKKKYALLSEDGVLKIKGFETVRRNWSIVAKETQEEVLNIILKENNPKKALDHVKRVIQDLRDRKVALEKVIIFTQLQKEIEEYENKGPHVAAAIRMKAKGIPVGAGTLINFVVTSGSGMIRDRVKLPDEVEDNMYDAEYYISHQVIPSVERIFEVLGYSKIDLLESKDQSKLGKFF